MTRIAFHPLTIHLVWTILAWGYALVTANPTILIAWFFLSMIGWGMFMSASIATDSRR